MSNSCLGFLNRPNERVCLAQDHAGFDQIVESLVGEVDLALWID